MFNWLLTLLLTCSLAANFLSSGRHDRLERSIIKVFELYSSSANASIDDEDIDGDEKRGITFQAVHETRWQPPSNDDDDDYGVWWMEGRTVEGVCRGG